jgi:hypothetical protein
MDKTEWIKNQAWDDYLALNKKHCDYIETITKAKMELDKVLVWELAEYEEKLKSLMPYIKERIMDTLEIQRQKWGEEQREMTPLEKEPND